MTPANVYKDNPAYASERLGDTVVRLCNGELIYVNNVGSVGRVSAYKITDFNSSFYCTLDDVDIEPLPLGWTMYGRNCDFISRRPVRRYKQGTHWGNISGVRLDDYGGRNVHNYTLLETAVYNKYPDWNTALQLVEDVYRKAALSRDFAIDEEHRLWYKSLYDPIGVFNTKDQRIYLNANRFYLQETVEETLDHTTVIKEK